MPLEKRKIAVKAAGHRSTPHARGYGYTRVGQVHALPCPRMPPHLLIRSQTKRRFPDQRTHHMAARCPSRSSRILGGMSEASGAPVTKTGATVTVPEAAATPAGSEELERLRSEVERQRARADKAEAIAAERSGRINDLRQAMRMFEAAHPQRTEERHELVEPAPTPAPSPKRYEGPSQARTDSVPNPAEERFEQALAGDKTPWREIVVGTFGTDGSSEPPAPTKPTEQADPGPDPLPKWAEKAKLDPDPVPWEKVVAWQEANLPASSKRRRWWSRRYGRPAT